MGVQGAGCGGPGLDFKWDSKNFKKSVGQSYGRRTVVHKVVYNGNKRQSTISLFNSISTKWYNI